MNKKEIVTNMIDFIEMSERNLQAANFAGEGRIARADIVNNILNELEREMSNEN